MTSAKRTLFLAVAAATVALSSLGEGVAAASSSTSNVASPLSHRGLQRNGVVAICPDGSQCTRGRRCYKTGREGEDTGLEEYGCGDCFDIDDNNGRCEFAQEVFCVVSDNTDISRWFCVNEGKCINDQVGDIDRARCECTSRYEGPNCQLRKSANSITEEDSTDSTNNDPKTGIQSEGGSGRSLSIGAIVGIAVGGFVALIGLLLILGRRKGEESYNDSVISSVENTDDHEYA